MTTMTHPAETGTNPELDELAAALLDSAATIRGLEHDSAGVARRTAKLAAQLFAAGRLVARGRGEFPGAKLAAATASTCVAAATSAELSRIDNRIDAMRKLVVKLHEWRGHTASVPTTS